MKRYIYFIFLVTLIFTQDVHIWISEVEDSHLELSIKSNQDIYGFDFKIKSSTDESPIINYMEETFTNGYDSQMLYTIETGQGIVTDNNFNSDYSLQKPPSSFVYKISAGYLGDEVIEYQIYQDGSPLCDKIFRNSSFSFIDNPILGEYQSNDRNMKFAISDIVLFNKKIKP